MIVTINAIGLGISHVGWYELPSMYFWNFIIVCSVSDIAITSKLLAEPSPLDYKAQKVKYHIKMSFHCIVILAL